MPSETLFAFQTAFLQQIEIKNIHARHSHAGGNPEGRACRYFQSLQKLKGLDSRLRGNDDGVHSYSGLTKIRTRRRSRRQYK
ncbi:hypothetical protein H8A00_06845 [Neisseria meningitidis]|uniref:hypothetical protein n=1 Tax=Neisseria meningitidis TaxID=487 RepID=UPI000FF73FC4|nr:hypothetical protein [Neisseria meningitidis]MBG9198574.1 hypothetical protein [Neisseria meningitidis]MBJ1807350.1 hypothetical protein [Neisseria meningitidis]MBJ7840232.1 hypothetical protein [Neisseria meningitidis]RNJ82443.1 glycosyl transferase family 1 [Neisseria meningitidis]